MKMTKWASIVLLGAAVMLGCGESHTGDGDGGTGTDSGGGTSGFAGAYVMNACAPDDGQALRVLLYEAAVPECSADTERRSLQLYLFSGSDIIFPITSGTTVTSSAASGGFGNGNATLCPGGRAPCQTSGDFSVTFDTFEQDVGASGSYSITWADGTNETGTFDASWCMNGDILCG